VTERELERRAKHTLGVLKHVEEVSGSVSATCRYYGISRNCYYKWLRRYEQEGFEGLKDRSSAPHNSPKATQADVVEKILWLRQRYHFGPGKISTYLARYHQIKINPSGVWRILHCAGVSRLPSSQRYKRRENPVEALREATPRPPAAGGREVHRATRSEGPQKALLPVHGDRRLHPTSRASPPTPATTSRPPSPSSTTCCPNCPSPSTKSRPTTARRSGPRSTGTCSTRA
jgi:transposase